MTESIAQADSLLRGCSLFADLGEAEIAAIAARGNWLTAQAGEEVVRKGESGDDFYIVAGGVLEASDPDAPGEKVLGRLRRGEHFGEIALLEQTPRMATVRATSAARLLRLARDGVLEALRREPQALAMLQASVGHRRALAEARRYRPSNDKLVAMIASVTQVEDPGVLAELESEVQWLSLPPDTVLMREGARGDHLYFVVSGRLLVYSERTAGKRVRVAEVGPGETVGEMSILSDNPRSVSVATLRDSELLSLTREGFDKLVAAHPLALQKLVRLLVRRLQNRLRARSVMVQMPGGPEITPQVCRTVVETTDLVLRNLKITQTYHQLSLEMATILGQQNANWCTFATHASKTAGYSIRREELPLYRLWWSLRQRELVDRIATAVEDSLDRTFGRLGITARVARTVELISDAISAGNLKVFKEIAPIFAEFVQTCHGKVDYDPGLLRPLLDKLAPGPAAAGGQDLLADAVAHYYEAAFERDVRRRAELILLANCKVGLHEQTRLQPNIVQALDAPIRGGLVPLLRDAARPLPAGLLRPLKPLGEPTLSAATSLWRRAVTRSMMRIRLPYGEINLGRRLPAPQCRRMFPEVLLEPKLPELQALVDRYTGAGRGGRAARDWGVLDDRMTFIVNLFRSRQTALELFAEPFLLSQQEQMNSGDMPKGWL